MPKVKGAQFSGDKHMLVLHGEADSGKSTTLRMVYESVLQRAVAAKSKAQSNLHAEFHYFTNREVGVAMHGETKFGLLTRGDSFKHVRDGLAFLKAQGCTVIVCATRPEGTKPWQTAIDFASLNGFGSPKEEQKIKARTSARQAAENAAMAETIRSWAYRRLKR